jgi:hypothetical protein
MIIICSLPKQSLQHAQLYRNVYYSHISLFNGRPLRALYNVMYTRYATSRHLITVQNWYVCDLEHHHTRPTKTTIWGAS